MNVANLPINHLERFQRPENADDPDLIAFLVDDLSPSRNRSGMVICAASS
ncbi:MAG: hypothetical protein ABI178_01710 [Rhodanobacter sp.]